MKKSRFTLIELLVVIAIIAVLAGMLLPALSSAKSRARSLECVSNLKSIGGMVTMYWSDYQNGIPSMVPYNGDARSWASVLYECYIGVSSMKFTSTYYKQHLQPVLRGTIFACPELSANNLNKSDQKKSSYAYHHWAVLKNENKKPYSFPHSVPRVSPEKVKKPSSFLFMADGKKDASITDSSNTINPNHNSCAIDLRHPGKSVNYLMLDGHVENRNMTNANKSILITVPTNERNF